MSTHSPKCWWCDNPEVVGNCGKCHHDYCTLDASKINPALYCDDCQKDVEIVETIYTKTDESDYDMEKQRIVYSKNSCRQIIFKGVDWMFACQKICELPDEELKPILQYHKGFVAHIESTLRERDIRRAHSVSHVDGRIVTTSKTTRVKIVKQAKLNPNLTLEQMVKIADQFGITSAEDFALFVSKMTKVQ